MFNISPPELYVSNIPVLHQGQLETTELAKPIIVKQNMNKQHLENEISNQTIVVVILKH